MRESLLDVCFGRLESVVMDIRQLFGQINDSNLIPNEWENRLKAIRRPRYDISVVGVVKAGKSTFLNALIFKSPVLPAEASECTAALATICSGTDDCAHIQYMTRKEAEHAVSDIQNALKTDMDKESALHREMEGELQILQKALSRYDQETIQVDFPFHDLSQCLAKDWRTDNGNIMPVYRARLVKEAIIQTSNPLLQDNICFVDTPGIHSPVKSRIELTISKMQDSDCVILIIPPKGIDRTTVDFLRDVLPRCPSGKIFALIGKCDFLAQEMLTFDHTKLEQTIKKQVLDLQFHFSSLLCNVHREFQTIRVIPVAPKLVLDGPQSALGSNLDRLEKQLMGFLESGKGLREFDSSCDRLAALVSETDMRINKHRKLLEKEVIILSENITDAEKRLSKIKTIYGDAKRNGQIFDNKFRIKMDEWEKKFREIPENMIKHSKGNIDACFNDILKFINDMGWKNRHFHYEERAIESFKEMKLKIELEIFWSIRKKMMDALCCWQDQCRKDSDSLAQDYCSKIQSDELTGLRDVASLIESIFVSVELDSLQDIQVMKRFFHSDVGMLKPKLKWIFPPDSDLKDNLKKMQNKIDNEIEKNITENCERHKHNFIEYLTGRKNSVLNEVDREIRQLKERMESALNMKKGAEILRDQRLKVINQENATLTVHQSRLSTLRVKITELHEAVPVIPMQSYQELVQDIRTMVEVFGRCLTGTTPDCDI